MIDNYTNKMLSESEKIFVDTSAVMNVDAFAALLEASESSLLEQNKKIIVPKAVCLEMVKHLGNSEKKEIIVNVIELFCKFRAILLVENSSLSETEAITAFADPQLLAELTQNIVNYKQMLITNDRGLGHDVHDLNMLECCRGYQISVCYITKKGELRICEHPKYKEICVSEPETKEVVEIIKEPEKSKDDRNRRVHMGVPLATLAIGFVAGKYGKKMLEYLKKVA